MIQITKNERKQLESVGLFKHRRGGMNPQDSNFQVANKEHPSKAKTYYIAEEKDVMAFLEKWEHCNNIQKIAQYHLDQLLNKNVITENNIQRSGTYVPNALVYIAKNGDIYMERVTKLMLALGFWKAKK